MRRRSSIRLFFRNRRYVIRNATLFDVGLFSHIVSDHCFLMALHSSSQFFSVLFSRSVLKGAEVATPEVAVAFGLPVSANAPKCRNAMPPSAPQTKERFLFILSAATTPLGTKNAKLLDRFQTEAGQLDAPGHFKPKMEGDDRHGRRECLGNFSWHSGWAQSPFI